MNVPNDSVLHLDLTCPSDKAAISWPTFPSVKCSVPVRPVTLSCQSSAGGRSERDRSSGGAAGLEGESLMSSLSSL